MATIDPINNTTTPQFTTDKLKAQKDAEAAANSKGVNPLSRLDKDAFMKLLLTELRYQDPTSPMDTEKMLTQTSQLATLETQENTNKMMKELAGSMSQSMNMYALSAIGKMAFLGSNAVSKAEGTSNMDFQLYFKKDVKVGTIEIYDKDEKLVSKIGFGNLPAGVQPFNWDGVTDSGGVAPAGTYLVKAKYTGTDDKQYESTLGNYPIESVRFNNGKAEVRVGNQYIPLDKVQEIYQG